MLMLMFRVGVSKRSHAYLPTLTLTLTLITYLLTNRLNNKYIFRPRSVLVCMCVLVCARTDTYTHRAVIQTLLHAIFNSRFAPFGVVT